MKSRVITGRDLDIPTIAAQLDVTHVLEGSVRKAGDNILWTAYDRAQLSNPDYCRVNGANIECDAQ